MSPEIWNASRSRNGVGRYGTTILGIAFALALVAALAGLYSINAAATGPSAAASRIQSWVNQLGDEELTPARHLAQEHLEQAGEASIDPLITALHSPDSALRRNSAEMLGFIGSSRAFGALIRAMANDPVPSVRSRAAWALGELHDLDAVSALELASVIDHDIKVRQEASGSLDALRAHLALMAGKNDRNTSAFAIAPAQPDLVYLAEMNRVSVSRDGGKTWSPVSGNLPSRVSALSVSPSNASIVYAGTESMGLYESADGGTTWGGKNQGLGLNPGTRLAVTAIAVDPRDPDRIYVAAGAWIGTSRMTLTPVGVVLSLDGGDTWQSVNLLAGDTAITRLVIFGNTLYASSSGGVSSLPL